MTLSSQQGRYAPAWRRYRLLRSATLLSISIGFVGILVAVAGFGARGPLPLLLMIPAAVLQLKWQYWRCPRCRRAFFVRGMARNSFTGHCMHCGLPKWATEAPIHE
jgi:hypothetical protein